MRLGDMRSRRVKSILSVLLMSAVLGTAACAAPAGAVPARTSPSSPTATPARYADGLPRFFAGQPVLRGEAALDHARRSSDSAPFLVGGWVTNVPGLPIACPLMRSAGADLWLFSCGQPAFSDLAGDAQGSLVAAGELTFHFVDTSRLESGPAILRVHVHDPRAAECGDQASACTRAMVVDAVLWTGDAATAPSPFDLVHVTSDLRSVVPGVALDPLGGAPIADCGPILPATRDYLVRPLPADVPSVSLVEIAPSSDALARALPLGDGTEAALSGPPLVIDNPPGGFECRWLRVANLALLVRTSDPPRATDRSFMDRLVAALAVSPSN